MATNDYSIASLVGLTAVTFSLRIFARSQDDSSSGFPLSPDFPKEGLTQVYLVSYKVYLRIPSFQSPNHQITVFENHRRSLIQHCERSEQRLHFE